MLKLQPIKFTTTIRKQSLIHNFLTISRSSLSLETVYDFSKSPLVKDAQAKTILSIKAMYGNNHKSMMNFRLYLDVRNLRLTFQQRVKNKKLEQSIKSMFKIEIEFWAMELIEKRIGLKVRGDETDPKLKIKHQIETVKDITNEDDDTPKTVVEKVKNIGNTVQGLFTMKTVEKVKKSLGILQKLNKNPVQSVFYMQQIICLLVAIYVYQLLSK